MRGMEQGDDRFWLPCGEENSKKLSYQEEGLGNNPGARSQPGWWWRKVVGFGSILKNSKEFSARLDVAYERKNS